MSATTAAQFVKFYSEKSKAKRALKAIGDTALAAADTLLVHEGADSKRWGFVVATAEAVQAGVTLAHPMNVEAAHREIAQREAEGEDMSTATVDPLTSAIVKVPEAVARRESAADDAEIAARNNGSATPEADDESNEEDETHKPVMAGGFASMLGQMMGQSVAPADAQSPSKKKAAPKVTTGQKIEKDRPMQNGVKRPSVGGMCRAVWDALDGLVAAGTAPTAKDVKALSETHGWNANNASIEFYQWRKFNGIKGRQVKA